MKKREITSFEEAVQYLYDTPRFTTKNSMEDTKAFLRRLGSPDRELRILHVAGTNGKGSVCAYMRSVLEEAGYRVAVFTSPHLVDVRERFVIAGEMISKEAFMKAFLHIYQMLEEGYHPTFFEYLFFIAMLVFAEEKPDFCILETGLGGRLDATNSVEKKELSVVTRIGLDHVEYLGDTLELIAGEKAGIFAPNTPAVYWDTCEETSQVFDKKAKELGISALKVSNKDYRFLRNHKKSIAFSLCTEYYENDGTICENADTVAGWIDLELPTIAAYQMENATLAMRALCMLRTQKITSEIMQRGVKKTFWAGRMEEVLPDVYVDGAHNEDGVRAFLETVAADGCPGKRCLLFSVVQDKAYEEMVKSLVSSGLFKRFAIAPMQTGRAVAPDRLHRLFAAYPNCEFQLYENVQAAFRGLLHSRKESERIYVAGSLYLVGEIKELLENDQF